MAAIKPPPPIRKDAPLPDTVAWRYHLRPPTIQGCLDYQDVIHKVHREADGRASAMTLELNRHRAVTEAEMQKALLLVADEMKPFTKADYEAVLAEVKRKPGWFKRIFGGE